MTDRTLYIRSARNPRFRAALKLRDRKGRREQRRFLIDGVREIQRAVEHAIQLVEVYVCTSLATSANAQALLAQLASRHLPCLDLPAPLWGQLAYGARKDGVIAVAATPAPITPDLPLGNNPLVVVLESVEKPGNIGAVVRTAAAVGADCLVLADGNDDLYNPNTIRASIGAVFCLPVFPMRSDDAVRWLQARGLRILVARVDADVSCFELDLCGPVALVLGSESEGVSAVWRDARLDGFRVPMPGAVDSLNVSVTAAVILYETWRQRAAV